MPGLLYSRGSDCGSLHFLEQFRELLHGQALFPDHANDVQVFQFPDLLFQFLVLCLQRSDLAIVLFQLRAELIDFGIYVFSLR